jgi:hypothetical protein
MNYIKKRVQRIEEKIKVASKDENLQEQFRNFQNGMYGTSNLMKITVAYLESKDKALERFPEALRILFRDAFEKAKNGRNYHLDDPR